LGNYEGIKGSIATLIVASDQYFKGAIILTLIEGCVIVAVLLTA
jgi:hypothetical protein